MNIVLGTDYLDQNYRFGKFGPKIEMCAMFTNFDTQN